MTCRSDAEFKRVRRLFYDNLLAAIGRDGRSYSAIERDAGMGKNAIANGLKKGSMPTVVTLLKMCAAFGCTPNDLLKGCHMKGVGDD